MMMITALPLEIIGPMSCLDSHFTILCGIGDDDDNIDHHDDDDIGDYDDDDGDDDDDIGQGAQQGGCRADGLASNVG